MLGLSKSKDGSRVVFEKKEYLNLRRGESRKKGDFFSE
jgi:hypothetical protein